MSIFRYVVLTTCVALSFYSAYSQKIQFFNVADIINEADALYDSGKYTEAIALLETIPERDTAYIQSLTHLAYSHVDGGNYDQAIEVCELALKTPSTQRANLLRVQALAMSKKGNLEQTIAFLEDAIKKYPLDANLLVSLGVALYNKKEYIRAEETFFRVLDINPFHQSAHLNLARLSIGQGKKVHAMLAMGLYLGINEKDNAHLVLLNNFLDNQVVEEGSITSFGTNAPSRLDQMIRAKIVGEEGYKSIFSAKAPVIQQFELLFDQLSTIPTGSDDRYVRFYLPVYKAIKESNSAEAFVYHLLSSSSIDAAAKWRNKNEKALNVFYATTNAALKKHRENLLVPEFGFSEPVNAWYYTTNQVEALGNINNDKRLGRWVFLYANGERQAEGMYNNLGVKTGTWKYYYNDGAVKSVENYDNGEVTAYSRKGGRIEHFFLKDDEIDGDVELYYEGGPLKEKLKFVAGKRDGQNEIFFHNGVLKARYEYKEGNPEGDYVTYHANGKISERGSYRNGKLHGKYESFYANGTLFQTGQYTDGQSTGSWKYYFSNGTLKSTGAYNEKGTPNGEWTYHDDSGLLREKRNYDSEGRLQGEVYYFDEGKLYCTSVYRKDVLVKDTYYDPNGKVISTSGGSDGTFYSKNYFSTGQLRSEGHYKKGKIEGLWKFYNRYGVVVSEYQYRDNLLHGTVKNYYSSGELKSELEYQDGVLHGYFREYYRNGKTKQEGWYKHGNREQQWLAYHPNGTVESDYYFVKGKSVGKGYEYGLDGKKYFEVETDSEGSIVAIRNFDVDGNVSSRKKREQFTDIYEDFTPNNKLRSRIRVLCGNYAGVLEKFYPDGTLMYKYEFIDGEKNGEHIYNELNGEMSVKGMYANNERTGLWRRYHENGKLYGEGKYRDDVRDSLWVYYHDNGNISSRGWFRDDKRHGISTFFAPDGQPLIEKRYHYGDVVAYRSLTNINDTTWTPFSGDGNIEVYYANGNKAFLEEYKNGLLHGADRLYYPDGQLHSETIYSGGDLNGEFRVYYPNGKLKERGTYLDDEADGTFERYGQDGTLETRTTYKMGYRNGTAVIYRKGVKYKEVNFWFGIVQD